jgi:hypothetical protein
MTKSLEEKPGLSAPDAKVLRDIQRVGWHITGVFAQKNEKGPEWAFSIGLFHSFQHPEVVVFGLPFGRCMEIVTVVGKEVQAGKRYEPGGKYADVPLSRIRIIIVWKYQSESGQPIAEDHQWMNLLEDTLESVLKDDGLATLALVSTGEDLREWTYYAKSEDEFMDRLNYAFAGMTAFPIEIHTACDPKWDMYEQFKAGVKEVVN